MSQYWPGPDEAGDDNDELQYIELFSPFSHSFTWEGEPAFPVSGETLARALCLAGRPDLIELAKRENASQLPEYQVEDPLPNYFYITDCIEGDTRSLSNKYGVDACMLPGVQYYICPVTIDFDWAVHMDRGEE